MHKSFLLLAGYLICLCPAACAQWQQPGSFQSDSYPSNRPIARGFWIGSKEEDVFSVQGTPDSVQRPEGGVEVWHYGRSTVTMNGGAVSAYDNAGKNLNLQARFDNNVVPARNQFGGNRPPPSQANAGLQPTQQANPDINPYLKDVERHVKRFWQPPHGYRIGAAFKIHRSGNVTDLRITESSGDPQLDNSLLNAIVQSAPFRPPPGTDEHIDMQMMFGAENPIRNR